MKKLVTLTLALCLVFTLLSGVASAGTLLDNGRYDKLVVAIDGDPQDLEGDDVNVGSRYYWIYGIYESLFDFADDSSGQLLLVHQLGQVYRVLPADALLPVQDVPVDEIPLSRAQHA